MPGSAATTSGAASMTLMLGMPLKTVTKRIARSTKAGGSPSTSQSSCTLANGARRGL